MELKKKKKTLEDKWEMYTSKVCVFNDISAADNPFSRRRPDQWQLALMGISAAFISA